MSAWFIERVVTMKSILACLLLLALAVSSAAQKSGKQPETHPDLTGTWALDKSKSGRGSKFDSTLVISHRDPELRITRTDVKKRERVTREYVFYTDGRGESNPFYYGDAKFESKTKWEGIKVVAYPCRRMYQGAKCKRGTDSWMWQLSEDGQTLTHRTSAVIALPDATGNASASLTDNNKLVYRRVP